MATVQISPPQVTTPADSTKRWILIFACLLLLLQTIPLLGTRWVADESWYTAPADSLAHHGELRVRAFPDTGGQGRFEAMSPALMMILAGFFKVLGTSLYSAKAPYL